MTTDKSSEREAFVYWWRHKYSAADLEGIPEHVALNAAWAAWQARAALPQQAQEPPSDDLRELGKWLNEEPNRPIDRSALARVLAWAQVSAPQQAQDDELHFAVCQAVSIMNASVELVRTEGGRKARDILRQALIDYADRAAIAKGEHHE